MPRMTPTFPVAWAASALCVGATTIVAAPCAAQAISNPTVALALRPLGLLTGVHRDADPHQLTTVGERSAADPAAPLALSARVLAIIGSPGHRQWQIGSDARFIALTPLRSRGSISTLSRPLTPEDNARNLGLALSGSIAVGSHVEFISSGAVGQSRRRLVVLPIEAHRLTTRATELSAGFAGRDHSWSAMLRWQNVTASRRSVGMVRAAEIMGGAPAAGHGWFVDLGLPLPGGPATTMLGLTVGSTTRSRRDADVAGVAAGTRDASARMTLTMRF